MKEPRFKVGSSGSRFCAFNYLSYCHKYIFKFKKLLFKTRLTRKKHFPSLVVLKYGRKFCTTPAIERWDLYSILLNLGGLVNVSSNRVQRKWCCVTARLWLSQVIHLLLCSLENFLLEHWVPHRKPKCPRSAMLDRSPSHLETSQPNSPEPS